MMEWLSRKRPIAGIFIPNWIIVLATIVVILVIYTTMGIPERHLSRYVPRGMAEGELLRCFMWRVLAREGVRIS